MSLGIIDNATQLIVLIASPILLLLLVYFSSKVLRGFSHASRSKKRELDGEEELLQLLLLSGLLDSGQHESDSLTRCSSVEDQDRERRRRN